ncbi:hypothetical protein [Collimonas arenae]|uniref:hypothetical protein n=1 Tax=Collimonas arenae TaxID=279058 RepID=UPI000FE13DAC|nr:hypothetical protein [Collimonas arenae]
MPNKNARIARAFLFLQDIRFNPASPNNQHRHSQQRLPRQWIGCLDQSHSRFAPHMSMRIARFDPPRILAFDIPTDAHRYIPALAFIVLHTIADRSDCAHFFQALRIAQIENTAPVAVESNIAVVLRIDLDGTTLVPLDQPRIKRAVSLAPHPHRRTAGIRMIVPRVIVFGLDCRFGRYQALRPDLAVATVHALGECGFALDAVASQRH